MMAIVWVGLVIGQKGEDVTGSSVMWALWGGEGWSAGGRTLGGVTSKESQVFLRKLVERNGIRARVNVSPTC